MFRSVSQSVSQSSVVSNLSLCLFNFLSQAKDGLFSKVDWVQWFYGTGMPPHTPEYDTTLADVSIALAGRWAKIKEVSDGDFSPPLRLPSPPLTLPLLTAKSKHAGPVLNS